MEVTRLGLVEGYGGKQNEVIFCGNPRQSPSGNVIYFGGDVQDYSENMLAHRDNFRHEAWNLEATAKVLKQRFPEHHIWVVKPAHMQLKTFSVYSNFVLSNEIGGPTHSTGQKSWNHLYKLLASAIISMKQVNSTKECSSGCDIFGISYPLNIIGFSKGCVVLNQLLYDLEGAKVEEEGVADFLHGLVAMYWLDGGHSSGCNTWVTDKSVLSALVGTGVAVHIHVTPYQVKDNFRIWIGKEQKLFVQRLKRLGISTFSTLHFEDEERCIEQHFQVLKVF